MSTQLIIIIVLTIISLGSLIMVSTRDYSTQRRWGMFWCATGVLCWIVLVLYVTYQCLLWALSQWSM